ncbi:unnamed protein product [Moneuplotes crassus]|uniref:Uncharacterized protein n=1 Tax=Euplotes crassus TaxID=5936 RepID=A0AAD1UFZ3_EUPCR|nr:unnamed protein product [Moneuplotes crassus]
MDSDSSKSPKPLRNKVHNLNKAVSFEETKKSLERTKSLIHTFNNESFNQPTSPNNPGHYQSHTFKDFSPNLRSSGLVDPHRCPLNSSQNLKFSPFHKSSPTTAEKDRMHYIEENYAKFKELNSARIQKGFIIINKVFDELDFLKKSLNQYKENIELRRAIMADIHIEEEDEENKRKGDIVFASPCVPDRRRNTSNKRKRRNRSKKSRSNSRNLRSIQTQAEENMFSKYRLGDFVGIEQKEGTSIFNNSGMVDLKSIKYSDGYGKLVLELKEKTLTGLNEDIYNLGTFDQILTKIETQCWVLKDSFYQSNKELRKTLFQPNTEEYLKETNELKVLEAYKSSQKVGEVYERQIKWLKLQREKLLRENDEITKKYKELKKAHKVTNLSWERLQEENSQLVKGIREIEADFIRSKAKESEDILSKEESKHQSKDENHPPNLQKDSVQDVIDKINDIIDSDSEMGQSKSSEYYKQEISNLNKIIDTLMTRLNPNSPEGSA